VPGESRYVANFGLFGCISSVTSDKYVAIYFIGDEGCVLVHRQIQPDAHPLTPSQWEGDKGDEVVNSGEARLDGKSI